MGLMALPIRGAWAGIKSTYGPQQEDVFRDPRTALGRAAAKNLSREEREDILKAFKKAEEGTTKRRADMRERAKRLLEGDEGALDIIDSDTGGATKGSSTGGEDGAQQEKVLQAKVEESKGEEKEAEKRREQVEDGKGGKEMEEDVKREKEVKEAERRGYERALAELKMGK
jgi:hypothetical protein